MKKYFYLILVLSVLMFLTSSSYTHEEECCVPCPMCKIFNDASLGSKSKSELLKMKKLIERHLNRKTVIKLGDEILESLQGALSKVDENLERMEN